MQDLEPWNSLTVYQYARLGFAVFWLQFPLFLSCKFVAQRTPRIRTWEYLMRSAIEDAKKNACSILDLRRYIEHYKYSSTATDGGR